MYFYDEQHEENFKKMLQRYPAGEKDREYRVACYIIAHPEIFPKATKQNWEFPFEKWRETEDFSHGIKLLVNLGFHLFNGGDGPFDLIDGIVTWDTGNFSVFQQACEIRKGWA